MAWIYSQASADYHSLSGHGSGQSLIVKKTNTLKPCCCHECQSETYVELLSGMTCELCGASGYQELTSFMADSRARISVLRDVEQVWQESEADFISRSKDLSEKQKQISFSLKTSLQSGQEDLLVWLADWPVSGMIVDGQLFQPLRLELRTYGSGGSYLPTPTAQTYGSNQGGAAGRTGKKRHSLETIAKRNLWPTPRTTGLDGGSNSRRAAKARGMWPIPCARDFRSGMSQKNLEKRMEHPRGVNLAEQLQRVEGPGQLSPMWVEWLMGYDIGWTELKDWAMQWFRSKRGSRSKDLSA